MNRNLWLLAAAQGLFLTNNVVFIAINGLVGLSLAPLGWMATLPVMGYVVGGALSTPLVARTQSAFGRKGSFQIGLLVAFASALLCYWAAADQNFWLLVAATVIAGYYSANGQLYRLRRPNWRRPTSVKRRCRWCWPVAWWARCWAPTWPAAPATCWTCRSPAPTWRWRWWPPCPC
jgi:MFS family permease